MCRVLAVHFSGFYAWLKEPLSQRAQEDIRQTDMIKQAWADSGKVYGYRKLTDDLRDAGETCSENRVARLASIAGIAAQRGGSVCLNRFWAFLKWFSALVTPLPHLAVAD